MKNALLLNIYTILTVMVTLPIVAFLLLQENGIEPEYGLAEAGKEQAAAAGWANYQQHLTCNSIMICPPIVLAMQQQAQLHLHCGPQQHV